MKLAHKICDEYKQIIYDEVNNLRPSSHYSAKRKKFSDKEKRSGLLDKLRVY